MSTTPHPIPLESELATEPFTIKCRWSWLADIKVEIECDPTAPRPVKLGLAVKAAFATGADLTGADLRDADLRGADLTGAVLTGADLTGAVLTGADLRGADLRGADLTGADLRDAVLTGADLTGADLTGADLTGADLTGAVLRGADLRDADLRGEKINRIFAIAGRLDGYTFYGIELGAGGVKIAAGCRWYTPAEYRAHILAKYPDTDKARETGRILDLIEGRAVDLGISATPTAEISKPKRSRKKTETQP